MNDEAVYRAYYEALKRRENKVANTIESNEYIPNPAEDQAWEEQKHLHDIHERNKAAMAAWNAAGVFIVDNAEKLGKISIREAYERGFMEGYKRGRAD